uniref:Uncharacterized protein n=1 Tax=Sphaerodactylus townsendi TaxID=933632 RepID=A0ACB8F331_9SAUR
MPVPNAMHSDRAFPEWWTSATVISLLALGSVHIPEGEGGRVEVRRVLGRLAPGANGAHSAAGLCRGSSSGTVDHLTGAQEKGTLGAAQPTDAAYGCGSPRRGFPGTELPNAPLASSTRPPPLQGPPLPYAASVDCAEPDVPFSWDEPMEAKGCQCGWKHKKGRVLRFSHYLRLTLKVRTAKAVQTTIPGVPTWPWGHPAVPALTPCGVARMANGSRSS